MPAVPGVDMLGGFFKTNPILDYPERLDAYEPCFSMIDPDTKETYWRMRSRDSSVSARITANNVRSFRKIRAKASLKTTLVYEIYTIIISVVVLCPLYIFREYIGARIFMYYVLLVSLTVVAIILFSGIVSAVICLFKKSIEEEFLEAMQAQEAAAKEDHRATLAEMPPGRPPSPQTPVA